jgi:hypothetical protein
VSPAGDDGCCGPPSMSMGIDCADTIVESADIYIRLDQAPTGACFEYTVEYRYHMI